MQPAGVATEQFGSLYAASVWIWYCEYPEHGIHQAGISTPTQEHVHFLPLDVVSDSPEYNNGQRILRRGYSYADGISDGAAAAGQLFICFQRDPRVQFIPMQTRLALNDLLNEHTKHVGSAIFACPPGTRPGGFVGEGLFT